MSTTQPLRWVSEQGLEAWEAEEGRMMWAFASRVIETVEEVLKVGRRMEDGFWFGVVLSLELSFELSSTAVGGGATSEAGEEPLSGV